MAGGGSMARVRLVRCPKCHTLLTESADVPVYECGRCGTALQSKHFDSGQGLSLTATTSSAETNYGSCPIPIEEHSNCEVSCSSSIALDEEVDVKEIAEPDPLQLSRQGSTLDTRFVSRVGRDNSSNSDYSSTRHPSDELSYDVSISSSDDGHRVPNKFSTLSRRTFRNRNAPMADAPCRDPEQKMSNSTTHVNGGSDGSNSKSSVHQSNSMDSLVYSIDDDDPNRSIQGHESYLDCNDEFVSVRSWMGSDEKSSSVLSGFSSSSKILLHHDRKGDDDRSIAKLATLKDDRVELLKKANELRYQLSRLCTNPKYNRIPLSGGSDHRPCSYLPGYYCSCVHCSSSDHCYQIKAPRDHDDDQQEGLYQKMFHRNSKEKRQAAGLLRHYRSVLGGAPFVACSGCSRVLLLPVELISWRRRHHKVKCGGCSRVIVVSLQARAEAAAAAAEAVEPSSSSSPLLLMPAPPSAKEICPVGAEAIQDVVRRNDPASPSSEGVTGWRDNIVPLHELMGYSSARHVLVQPLE